MYKETKTGIVCVTEGVGMNKRVVKWGASILGILLLVGIFNYEMGLRHSWRHWNLPLSGRVIVIDPGHGGPDGGAESGNIQEKDIALNISKQIKDYLQQSGALVYLTRNTDTDLAKDGTKGLSRRKTEDLKKRVAFIQDHNPDCVVSIHLNAIPSPRWRGAQTFFHPKSDNNEKLAKFIQDSLRTQLENTDRYAKAINHVYLLKKIDTPAALVEVGFLSNPSEKQLLETKDYQRKIAASIYQGIMRYYTNEKVPHS